MEPRVSWKWTAALLIGAGLITAVTLFFFLPIVHCPYCDHDTFWKYNHGRVMKVQRFSAKECARCNYQGRISLAQRLSFVWELRDSGFKFPLIR